MSFMRQYFPEPDYNAHPIFVGKSIDTVVVKVYALKNIIATDTLGIKGSTVGGVFYKEYTGITADSGTVFMLDTIHNALFTSFNCTDRTFLNDIQCGRVRTGYYKYISGNSLYDRLSDEDETKMEMTFHFNY